MNNLSIYIFYTHLLTLEKAESIMQHFKLIRIFMLLAILFGSLSLHAIESNGKASIKGQIRDSYSKSILEYANVALF